MTFAIWAVVLGLLLITMAMTGALLKRLPVSPSMLYLAAGAALGPAGIALLPLDPINDSTVLEHVTEAAVLISLFVTGATFGHTVAARDFPGAGGDGAHRGRHRVDRRRRARASGRRAILLGAILAPTDPVLASEVQVADP
jgi:NhaP-type Na+/H+ or K+/H+ antiporter